MRRVIFVMIIVALVLAACGGSGGPVTGDPKRGEDLYNRSTLGKQSAEGCVTCHNYDASEGEEKDAPYTAGTATRAATRVPGLSAEEYIHESILSPDDYVVEGWQAGDMYADWGKDLTEQQIADLVSYLLTEK
jgi:sulfur-oxidizing protein SoxX